MAEGGADLRESGFTGLEAAIVLITFVVVAGVFAFVVLGTGLFSVQESQYSIQQGVRQAASALEATGTAYGVSSTPDRLEAILIPIALTAGGDQIDVSTISIRYVSPHHEGELLQNVPLMHAYPSYGRWSVQETINDDGDSLLEPGERFIVNISPLYVNDLVPNGVFTIEIKPAGRAPVRLVKRVPARIDTICELV